MIMNPVPYTRYRLSPLLLLLCLLGTSALGQENGVLYRWDIAISRTPEPGELGGFGPGDILLSAGGSLVATALDGATLTLTGTGLMQAQEGPRVEGLRVGQSASGGGTWVLRDSPTGAFAGAIIGNGTYAATQLVYFRTAPGVLASNVIDSIGAAADIRAGVMVLRILYSDGTPGTLTFFTRLGGTPPAVPQLLRVTRGYVEFISSSATAIHLKR